MYDSRCLIYTRVSSDEQRQKGYSLDFQYKELIEYCKKQGFKVVAHFTESHTAKKPGRPEFNNMLNYAHKHKISNLIFLKNDRASRNPVDSAALSFMAEHQGFFIHLVQDNLVLCKMSRPQDFLIFEINNGFSNLYSRNLSVEVSSKMREKAEQGYYPSHAMVGYTTEKIAKRSYLVIDEEKAPYIKEIFELYSTGRYSYLSLAAEMRKRGFMISKAVKCGKSHIENILNNPVYMGDFIWNGKRYYNAKHEPIISRELYYYCQRIIKEKTTTSRSSKLKFLFSNIIKCKHCGCSLVGELKKKKYIYYHCTGNRGGNCKRKYLKEEIAEKKFIEILERLKVSDEGYKLITTFVKDKISQENAYNKEQLEKTQNKINKLKERLNKLFDFWVDEKINDELYKQKSADLQAEIDALNSRLNSYSQNDIKVINFSKKILELFKAAPELYLTGSLQTKQDLIKLLCSNFLWDGENVTIIIKKAFQPLVEIASLINGGAKATTLELLLEKYVKNLREPEVQPLIFKIDELLAA